MKTIVIQSDLLQATLDYLATKPYHEVAGLISAIQQQANDAAQQSVTEKAAEVKNA